MTTDDFRADNDGRQLSPGRAWYRSPMLWSVVIVLTLISIPVAIEFQSRGVGEPLASDKGAASRPEGTQPARAEPVEEVLPSRAPPMTRPHPARQTIMKCVENGRVTYGDGTCNGELVEVPVDTRNNVVEPDLIAFSAEGDDNMAKPDLAKLAVLIDSDNAPAALAKELLDEISKYGTANVKRAYGDWTTPNLRGWKEHLHKHAIQPIQQFRYTDGKNSTDSALIIDAMDLLHLGAFDGFCIVSSDSDFTRLATRLREAGKQVIGFGEKAKAAAAFVSACDKFVYLELLSAVEGASEAAKAADVGELPGLLGHAITTATRDDGWAALSAVGGLIGNTKPDFDPRSYGFSKLSELVRAQSFVEVKESPDAQGNIHLRVRLMSTGMADKRG